MAKIVSPKLRFRHTGLDVSAIRVRLHAAESEPSYDTPFDEVPLPPQDDDGYRRIALNLLPKIAGKEGVFDVDLSAVDSAGNESDFLQINSANFDLSPPAAPTDGALE
jgi:hypothetical protein